MTNRAGIGLLDNVDMRSVAGRRYRDICRQIVIDQGGADRIAETRLQLIRRFAAGSCLAEAMEAKMAQGEEIDVERLCALGSMLVRIASRIGLNRTAREIPSLEQYLASKSQPAEIDNEEPAQ